QAPARDVAGALTPDVVAHEAGGREAREIEPLGRTHGVQDLAAAHVEARERHGHFEPLRLPASRAELQKHFELAKTPGRGLALVVSLELERARARARAPRRRRRGATEAPEPDPPQAQEPGAPGAGPGRRPGT